MPELRARSRTPSTSRAGAATPAASGSPRKSASDSKNCWSCYSSLSPHRKLQVVTTGWFLLAGLVIAGGFCTVQHRVDFKFTGTLAERLAFTLRCLLLSGGTLAAAVKFVTYKRFSSSAINPLSGNERLVDVPNRILQNTLEQFVLHSSVLLSLATYLNAEQMKFVPLAAVLFVLGRIFFYLGYPTKRCFGFALTYIPTAIAFWVTVYFAYTKGLTSF